MYVYCREILKWKSTTVPHPRVACALCGRKMDQNEPCMSAIWAAQGGQYVQAYHTNCAYIVKLWGYPAEFLSPKDAEKWAMGLSCDQCRQRVLCPMYVFDCQKAIEAIRLMGGACRNPHGPRDGEEEEDG